jgi:hypothetical protein
MARQFVKFIDVKDIPLELLLNKGMPTGIRVKRLNKDLETGAESYFAVIPPHWSRLRSGYYESAVEILIMNGDLRIGENHLRAGCYCYIPAGGLQEPAFSDVGCGFLMLFDGPPVFIEADKGRPDAKETLRVAYLDINSMAWEPLGDGTYGAWYVKWLRKDPETTAFSAVAKTLPGWKDPRTEAHTVWEELFLMEGDHLMGDYGMMTAGGYIYHPENVPHGPEASKTGAIWFERSEKMIDLMVEEVPWGNEMVDRYLSSTQLFENMSHPFEFKDTGIIKGDGEIALPKSRR